MTYEDFVTKYEVEMTATLTEFNAEEKAPSGGIVKTWIYDAWSLAIKQKHGRHTERFTYRTGIGQRMDVGRAFESEFSHGEVKRGLNPKKYPGGCAWNSKGRLYAAKAPKLADVIQCLASDAGALESSFEDWASDYGYDSDSRQAEKTYKACVETAQQLIRLFGLDGLRELRECTETEEG